MAGPKVGTYVETFNNGTNTKLVGWTNTGVSLVSGRLRIACVQSFTGVETIGATPAQYDLTGSSITFQLFRPSANDGGLIGFAFTFPNGVEVGVSMDYTSTYAYTGDSYVSTGVASSTNPYFRIRESGGSISWDTSPDGVTWTQRRTATTPPSADSLTFGWFAGGGPSNTVSSVSYGEVDNVNTSGGGFSTSVAFSGSGQLARTDAVVTASATAAFSGAGSPGHSPSGVVMVGPSVAFSGVGNNGTTGTRSTLGSAAYGADGALLGAPRVGLRGALPTTAAGTLVGLGSAAVPVESVVNLETVWLNPARDLADGQAFPTLNGLKVTTEVLGESRRYTTGRLRTILRPGRTRTFDLTLRSLTRDQIGWLEQRVGELLCVRDDRGRKVYATFLAVPVEEHSYNREADVSLSLVEVTHTEAV